MARLIKPIHCHYKNILNNIRGIEFYLFSKTNIVIKNFPKPLALVVLFRL